MRVGLIASSSTGRAIIVTMVLLNVEMQDAALRMHAKHLAKIEGDSAEVSQWSASCRTMGFEKALLAINLGVEAMAEMIRSFLVRGLAVITVVLTYALGNVGTQVLSVAGISAVGVTATATPANAWRRFRHRRFFVPRRFFRRRRFRRRWW